MIRPKQEPERMNQKIEWYREVLEIEPNSKIFFPLARMLGKEGRHDEAIAVLRQGVGRHPDHVEARLFLVEELYIARRPVELQQEITVLSDLFKLYPGFWRAWGERLFEDDDTRDAGLAAIFMAAFLQNMPVSWAGVIEHGLKSLVGGAGGRPSAASVEAYPLTSPAPKPAAVTQDSAPSPVPEQPPAPDLAKPDASADAIPMPPAPMEMEDEDTADDEDEEPISLRTRSMADVLASQGDMPGALDIYEELLRVAPDAEKAELQARIDVLSGKAEDGNQERGAAAQEAAAQDEKKDWLSILAQRLEARSLQ